MVESSAQKEDLQNFSAERWILQTKNIAQTVDAIDVDSWVAFLYETTNLFKKMGSAMSMAFSDITTKAEVIQNNRDALRKERGADSSISLQDLIEDDITKGLAKLNGENNSKLCKEMYKGDKKLAKDDYRHQFTSTARTVLRNLWLLDFLHHFMTMLHTNRDAKLSACAKHAYSEGLGPHHPWVVRQAAKVAMLACPSRENFLNDTKATYEQIDEFKQTLEQFRGQLWEYYKQKAIIDLP
ncbi:glycolipid transfer protein domain-containing protein 1-like [Stylonychia lemnae]|uniref:Glycolipid transfer protein domain-containing protein 1-like n=1 Tax=Stylonychia lemnae TaxID=5949 RepID=A0A078ALW4_STYLE|nr:glycolipid transfer protein domain-containing protein 1-like [Stylonychia lemnae]|eukprot:CDW83219.1 glycolipid transfer protein domain-containing protein 1-like [Stylonychia lemnae]